MIDEKELNNEDDFNPITCKSIHSRVIYHDYFKSTQKDRDRVNDVVLMMYVKEGKISLEKDYEELSQIEKSLIIKIVRQGGMKKILENVDVTDEQLETIRK